MTTQNNSQSVSIADLRKDVIRRKFSTINRERALIDKRTKHYQRLVDAGYTKRISCWDLTYPEQDVTPEQLTVVKRVLGPLKVYSKYPAEDFARTNELIVCVTPEDDNCDLRFNYRVPYVEDGNFKCKVVANTKPAQTTPAETTYSLVCED